MVSAETKRWPFTSEAYSTKAEREVACFTEGDGDVDEMMMMMMIPLRRTPSTQAEPGVAFLPLRVEPTMMTMMTMMMMMVIPQRRTPSTQAEPGVAFFL